MRPSSTAPRRLVLALVLAITTLVVGHSPVEARALSQATNNHCYTWDGQSVSSEGFPAPPIATTCVSAVYLWDNDHYYLTKAGIGYWRQGSSLKSDTPAVTYTSVKYMWPGGTVVWQSGASATVYDSSCPCHARTYGFSSPYPTVGGGTSAVAYLRFYGVVEHWTNHPDVNLGTLSVTLNPSSP